MVTSGPGEVPAPPPTRDSSLQLLLDIGHMLGPSRTRFGFMVLAHLIPATWSLVISLSGSAVLIGLFENYPSLGSIRDHLALPDWLARFHDSLEADQRLIAGIAAGAVATFLGTISRFGLNYFSTRFLMDFALHMQARYFDQMLAASIPFHDASKRGQLVQVSIQEIKNCRTILSGVFQLVPHVLLSLIHLALLLWISPSLTLFLGAFSVGAWWLSRTLQRRQKDSITSSMRERNALYSILTEGLEGIRVLKSLARTSSISSRLATHSLAVHRLSERAGILNGLQGALIELLGLITVFGVMLFSFRFPQIIPAAVVLLFLFVAHRFISLVQATLSAYSSLHASSPSMHQVLSFLESTARNRETSGDIETIPLLEKEIRFDGVHFAYDPAKPILEGLDLAIRKGERLGIVGSSGTGKSTLAHLLLRFYEPTRGSIRLDDTALERFRLDLLRRRIGFLGQDCFVFNATILENLLMARHDATHEELIEAARRAHAHEFIEALPHGYETIVGERGIRLSGGQRQRINLAQVFLKNPEIIILDEATSALDSQSEAFVQEALQQLSRECTVLIIAHRESTLRFVDRIVVLENGRVAHECRWEDLPRLPAWTVSPSKSLV